MEEVFKKQKLEKLENSVALDAQNWVFLFDSETTFPSVVFDLTIEEAEALMNYCRVKCLNWKKTSLTDQQQVLLDALALKIDQEISKLNGKTPNNGIFIKISSRSPKDSVFYAPSFKKRLQDELETEIWNKTLLKNTNSKDFNTSEIEEADYFQFLEKSSKILKVYSGSEAIELLGYSERVFTDLLLYSDCEKLKKGSFNVKIILRTWNPFLKYSMEFRGFVFNHQLTSLTQYDNRIYFPEVFHKKQLIQDKILEFFEKKVRNVMIQESQNQKSQIFGLKNYSIDFAVLEEQNNQHSVVMIEMNPFSEITGTSLFDWKADVDVLTGKKPFEFRIIEEDDDLKKKKAVFNAEEEIPFEVASVIVNARKNIKQRLLAKESEAKSFILPNFMNFFEQFFKNPKK